MKKITIYFFLVLINSVSVYSEVRIIKPKISGTTTFAIFVDSLTFEKTSDAILRYKNSIERDNLPTYVLIKNWKSPDEIKNEIIKLYNSKPKLEGAVFIGDIPIPMIREAQHLTSAFKLDEQRFPWDRSSVPSDRYYDDLDLRFEFIKQDSLRSLNFYYRLLPQSPQKIEREIYTARIKPSSTFLKYEKIKDYLLKVSKQKVQEEKLDNVLVFTGQGYNSESLISWADESLLLLEHFPDAFKAGGRFKKYFYDMNKTIKKIILSELENPELDIAIFHAHGESDAQLLSSYGKSRNVNENIESIKFYLRSKIRSAKESGRSIEETREYFKKSLGVPDEWFEGAFDEEIIKKDSILVYDFDIHIADVRKINPQAKLIVFDGCFNGAFNLDEYIAGEYIFGSGNTIAGITNSVNVLQDLFVSELIGLLNFGVRVGEWHRYNNYLESHLIGDPTFRFRRPENISSLNSLRNPNEKTLHKLLNSDNAIFRAFAVLNLFNIRGEKLSDILKEIYLKDTSPNVRLAALKSLANLRDKNFENILIKSINDPNELIRRFSVKWMGLIGKKEYLSYIVWAAFNDESDRVRFNAKSVLELTNSNESMEIIKKEYEKILLEKFKYKFDTSIFYFKLPDKRRQSEIIEFVMNDTIDLRKRIYEVRTFRKYVYEDVVSYLLAILQDDTKPLELKLAIVEVLGWYTFSPQRFRIIQICELVINSKTSERLMEEALKTINRLKFGSNNPFTP